MRPHTVRQAGSESTRRGGRRRRAFALLVAGLALAPLLAVAGANPAAGISGVAPKGSLDNLAVTFVDGTPTVTLQGWSFDGDLPSRANLVAMKVNSSFVGNTRANLSRPDVAAAFAGVGSAHGYKIAKPLTPGTHKVCAVGVNLQPSGGGNATLGCRSVTVLGVAGSVDSAVQKDGTLRVTGWAIDGTRKTAVKVRITTPSGSTDVTAGASRPDVGAAFPIYGSKHGYDVNLTPTPGPVCVHVLNGSGGVIGNLGCRQVINLDIPTPGPDWQGSMLWAVNKEREGRAAPLTQCAALTRAAQSYAELMASTGWFAHNSPDGTTPWKRITDQGYSYSTAGENIAAGQPTVYDVMLAWVYSSGHYNNMVKTSFTHVGFGAARSANGTWYWVQDFGSGGNCA
ncbi:MAG TPA: CAP domain-containing protein [Acidimicrobiales bacterium]